MSYAEENFSWLCFDPHVVHFEDLIFIPAHLIIIVFKIIIFIKIANHIFLRLAVAQMKTKFRVLFSSLENWQLEILLQQENPRRVGKSIKYIWSKDSQYFCQ